MWAIIPYTYRLKRTMANENVLLRNTRGLVYRFRSSAEALKIKNTLEDPTYHNLSKETIEREQSH